jgi:hypothetical protein
MSEKPQSFAAFWPYYLAAHADRRTRALHYCGTSLALLLIAGFALGGNPWLLAAAPVAGYGPAWIGHMVFERNRPATFTYPVWSFLGDFRMLYLAATGRLRAELTRAGLR